MENVENHWATLKFDDFKINNINFTINHNYCGEKWETNVHFEAGFHINLEEKKANIEINVVVFPNYIERHEPFTLSMNVTGVFSIDSSVPPEIIKQLFFNNAVAIMFPYIRSAITSITATSGLTPFILPPINVTKLLGTPQVEYVEETRE